VPATLLPGLLDEPLLLTRPHDGSQLAARAPAARSAWGSEHAPTATESLFVLRRARKETQR
jgi:hypothetical protein